MTKSRNFYKINNWHKLTAIFITKTLTLYPSKLDGLLENYDISR